MFQNDLLPCNIHQLIHTLCQGFCNSTLLPFCDWFLYWSGALFQRFVLLGRIHIHREIHWYLGFCFIHANTCVPAAKIATLFLPLNRERNLFYYLILPDAPSGTIWILTEASDTQSEMLSAFCYAQLCRFGKGCLPKRKSVEVYETISIGIMGNGGSRLLDQGVSVS